MVANAIVFRQFCGARIPSTRRAPLVAFCAAVLRVLSALCGESCTIPFASSRPGAKLPSSNTPRWPNQPLDVPGHKKYT